MKDTLKLFAVFALLALIGYVLGFASGVYDAEPSQDAYTATAR